MPKLRMVIAILWITVLGSIGIANAQLVPEGCVEQPANEIESAEFYYTLGRACLGYDSRDAELARRYLDRALELDPAFAEAYAARAEAHFWLRQFGYAISDVTLALHLGAEDGHLLARRAFLFREIGDITSALSDLDKALTAQPDDPTLYLQAADYSLLQDQPEMAIAYLMRGVTNAPDNDALYMRLGDVYYELGERAQALEAYRTYLTLADEQSPVVRARILILERDLE